MADATEVQALEKISSEVDDSQMKVILSTQCIKAQAFLVDKLRKQAERSKERCSFISSANLRLQSEITQAQQEIKSLLISKETIKMANVELKKEWLMAKEKKLDVIERVKNGEKRYETLWNESKVRYESLPFVQKLLRANAEVINLEQLINKLEDDKQILYEQIEVQKETCRIIDRKRIIAMAEFIINERPKSVDFINKKSAAIKDLTKEMEKLDLKAKSDGQQIEAATAKAIIDASTTDTAWPLAQNFEDNPFMPKLQLPLLDFDALSVKLDQVKIKRVDSFNKTPEKINNTEVDANKLDRRIESTEEYISSFFNKPSVYEENKPQNYARMKLINILEDVRIDKDKAKEMVSKVNPITLQQVESISVDVKKPETSGGVVKVNQWKPLECEEIEEIDSTVSKADNLLVPPSQFLDIEMQVSQKEVKEYEETLVTASTSKDGLNLYEAHKSSQEALNKKRVSFDLPITLDNIIESDAKKPEMAEDIDANETINSQSDGSDEGYANKIKDMIMKKHYLDLSPQFVYTKNTMGQLNLQKNDDVITSKFFQQNQKNSKDILEAGENVTVDNKQPMEAFDIGIIKEAENKPANQSKKEKYSPSKDIGADMVSDPKRQKIHETQSDNPVSGFMFGHGSATTAECMNDSISTIRFEDGDDYPQCLDSSLLVSPKADLPVPVAGESQDVLSQDVPNFLTGLRKTGFSFFGGMSSSVPKPDSNAQNQAGGFSFNFGGEDKKSRGGFFNMFK